jgi:hypothetical protein
VDVDNIGTGHESVTAHAVCLERGGFSYVTKRFEARRNVRTKGKASCRGETLNVGGGPGAWGRQLDLDRRSLELHEVRGRRDQERGLGGADGDRQGPRRDFKVFAIGHR